MAFLNKPSFAVSVTPKGTLANVDGTNVAMTVMHEHVRKTVGGNGEITGDDNTIDGTYDSDAVSTPITSNAGSHGITFDGNVNLLFIKHTGFLFGTTTACGDADTVKIEHDTDTIAELRAGEAMVLPRPLELVLALKSGSGNHVGVEIVCIGT